MKKTIFFKMVAASLLILNAGFASAQKASFTNNLPCDVEIFIEVWAGAPSSCGPNNCPGGMYTIAANSAMMIDFTILCGQSTFNDICIIVQKIGSCSINTGIHLTNTCHTPNSLVDSGTLNPNCCSGAPTWTATWNPWTHQFVIN